MQKFQDVVLDSQGRPVAGAVIAVQEYPGGGAATVYETDAVGAAYTPTTDAFGAFFFYAPNGNYSYTVTVGGVLRKTVTNVILYDPSSESTWTPKFGFFGTESTGAAYSIQRGWYTKVGDWVTATGYLIVSNKGSSTSSGVCILGLPFVADSTTQTPGTLILGEMTSGILDRPVYGYVDGGSSYFSLFKTVAGDLSPAAMSDTDVRTNFNCRFQVTYKV
jgi:hypothetical protein